MVYGLHTVSARAFLWRDLLAIDVSYLPWLGAGDYNTMLSTDDRLNGNLVTDYEIRDFQQFLIDMEAMAIKSKGAYYSWSNKADGNRIWTRIDWGIVNQLWMNSFGNVEVVYLPPSLSDHSPLLFEVFHVSQGKGKPFRFLNCLAEHDSFLSVVEEAWKLGSHSNPMVKVWFQLKKVKERLKTLNSQHFSNVAQRVQDADLCSTNQATLAMNLF